jgi:hypothetical protein
MKKVIYDSWIARNLLFKGYSTITLTAFVFTRYKSKEEMSQYVRNHECTYARQWAEMFLLGFFVVFVLQIPFDISSWWYLLPFFAFYIWYLLEVAIRSIIIWGNGYRYVAFEREARENQYDNTYLENGNYFTLANVLWKD